MGNKYYSESSLKKIQELSEFASEYGFKYLGVKDAVHFYIDPVGAYYDYKHQDIEINSEFYEQNSDDIPTYDPVKEFMAEKPIKLSDVGGFEGAAIDNTGIASNPSSSYKVIDNQKNKNAIQRLTSIFFNHSPNKTTNSNGSSAGGNSGSYEYKEGGK